MLYLLTGDDDYAIRCRARALIPQGAERHSFDHTTLADLERLLRLAESLSLLGKRYVWCRTPLLQKPVDGEVVNALSKAAKSESTVLILSSKSIDRRIRTTKALLNVATVETYALLDRWNTKALIQQADNFARDVGLTLDNRSLGLLVSRVGNQTQYLAEAVSKLSLWHTHTQQPITPAIIERLVSIADASAIDLSKHLLDRQLAEALTCLQALEADEPAEKIIRTLGTQFRTWRRAKALLTANASHEAIAAQLQLGNPNRVFFLKRELQTVSLQRLERAQTTILAAELALKQGDPEALQTLALALCA